PLSALIGLRCAALVLFCELRVLRGSTLFPYTTLFRSFSLDVVTGVWVGYDRYDQPMGRYENGGRAALPIWIDYMEKVLQGRPKRSEEHTSELQSRENLVCRLLLEKKKVGRSVVDTA